MITLHKITLNNDCVFTVEDITVLCDTKHGKCLGLDEKQNRVYEKIPSRIWVTDKGRFNTNFLDKIKSEKDGLSFTTDKKDLKECKQMLKYKLMITFRNIGDTIEQRKQTALQKVLDYHVEFLNVNNSLKKAMEIKI